MKNKPKSKSTALPFASKELVTDSTHRSTQITYGKSRRPGPTGENENKNPKPKPKPTITVTKTTTARIIPTAILHSLALYFLVPHLPYVYGLVVHVIRHTLVYPRTFICIHSRPRRKKNDVRLNMKTP